MEVYLRCKLSCVYMCILYTMYIYILNNVKNTLNDDKKYNKLKKITSKPTLRGTKPTNYN